MKPLEVTAYVTPKPLMRLECNHVMDGKWKPSAHRHPVKNVTGIFSCLFDGSLVWFGNEAKSTREISSFS